MFELRKLALAVDFSSITHQVLHHGAAIASRFGAEVLLVHVVRPVDFPIELGGYGASSILSMETLRRFARERLRELKEGFHKLAGSHIRVREAVLEGHPEERVLAYCGLQGVNLLVVGAHRNPQVERFYLGSTTLTLVRDAHLPVLVVRPRPPEWTAWEVRRILVPVDLTHRSEHALKHALVLREKFGAEITVLYVVPHFEDFFPYGETEEALEAYRHIRTGLEQAVEDWLKEQGIHGEVHSEIREGSPALTIVEATQDYDLVVMGCLGRLVHPRCLGEITEKVLKGAHSPVWVVK